MHQDSQLLPWAHQHRRQQIWYFFKIRTLRLAHIYGEDAGKGCIVSKCFKVDKFDEDVRIILRVNLSGELIFNESNLSFDDVLLLLFCLSFADDLYQLSQVAGEDEGCILFGKQVIHINLIYIINQNYSHKLHRNTRLQLWVFLADRYRDCL